MAGGITTICVLGFPPDALPRELKNLCRFVPGFEGSHVAFSAHNNVATALFVKFATTDLASAAIETLNGIPFDVDVPDSRDILKVEFARREMEVRASPLPAPLSQTVAPAHKLPGNYGVAPAPIAPMGGSGGYQGNSGGYQGNSGGQYSNAGGYHGNSGGYHGNSEEIVTLAILALKDKGFNPDDVSYWCQQQPGFTKLQINDRIGAIFCRFDSRSNAELAMQAGNQMQYGVEWARRNLDDDLAMKHAPPQNAPMMPASGGYGGWQSGGGCGPLASNTYSGPPSKRPRISDPQEIDTIAIVGLKEKQISMGPDGLQNWFQSRPGFMMLQTNDRIGSLFVKFNSRLSAEQAIMDCQEANGVRAEWARRNLDF